MTGQEHGNRGHGDESQAHGKLVCHFLLVKGKDFARLCYGLVSIINKCFTEGEEK